MEQKGSDVTARLESLAEMQAQEQKASGGHERVSVQFETAEKASRKPVMGTEKVCGEDAPQPTGPVGLDVGTSHIVVSHDKPNLILSIRQLNAFFSVPKSKFSENFLSKRQIEYFELDNSFFVYGYSAEGFANMFNASTRRPMKMGILSASEKESITVMSAIMKSLVRKPHKEGETLCFVVPGRPLGGSESVIYHESAVKRTLSSMGYSVISINEGMAVVMAELSGDEYTGIGVSMGGGMCNVCLSYLSFPVITFSIPMAGDFIDAMVGQVVGEPATKIKGIKEQSLDLSKEPKDRIIEALHIYYDEVIFTLLQGLQRVLTSAERMPKISKPIPLVLSGGTAMPNGCVEKFEKTLRNINLPVQISKVRLAKDLLYTPSKGALMQALTEAEQR